MFSVLFSSYFSRLSEGNELKKVKGTTNDENDNDDDNDEDDDILTSRKMYARAPAPRHRPTLMLD